MFEYNQSKWCESNVIGLHTYVRYNTDESQNYGTQQTTENLKIEISNYPVILLLYISALYSAQISIVRH